MPDYVIPIFLLFVAVLAFGWFYLQRAKARDASTTVETAPGAPTTPAVEPTTSETTSPDA
jgi:hypothetical protein